MKLCKMAKQSIVGIVFLLMIIVPLTMAIDVCPSQPIEYDFKTNTFGMAKLILNNISTVAQTRSDLVISLDRTWDMTGSASSYDYDGTRLNFHCDNSFSSCWFESKALVGDMTSAVIKINSNEPEQILYSRFYVEDDDKFYCYWRTDVYGDAKNLDTKPFCDDDKMLKRVSYIKFAFVTESPLSAYDVTINSIDVDFPNEMLKYTGTSVGNSYTVQIDGVNVETYNVVDCTVKNTTSKSNQTMMLVGMGEKTEEPKEGSSWTTWGFTAVFAIILVVIVGFGIKNWLDR